MLRWEHPEEWQDVDLQVSRSGREKHNSAAQVLRPVPAFSVSTGSPSCDEVDCKVQY